MRPNTDTTMLLALTHTLVSENLHDRTFLTTHCSGFERVKPYLMGESDGARAGAFARQELGGRLTPPIHSKFRLASHYRRGLAASQAISTV
jgi:Molybdopterin oxidoreductase